MDKIILPKYAVIALAEILFEEHLINEPTMKAIKHYLKSTIIDYTTISQIVKRQIGQIKHI